MVLDKEVQFIKDTVQQYDDGLITGWECYSLITERLGGVDTKDLLDEHEKAHDS